MHLGALPEPVAVWDANDPEWRDGCWSARFFWLTQTAIRHLYRTIRIEFYLIDAPFAIVHRAAVNSDGRKYNDPATGKLAMEPPATVMLRELPPVHLRS